MTPGRGATGLPLTALARQMICDPKFQGLWRVPVLVWASVGQGAEGAEVTLPGVATTRPRAGEPLVFEVRKAPDAMNALLGITLGRTSNNDIVIDDISVSRFHAVLQQDEKTGGWTIGDAGSSNGTLLRDERLKAPMRVPLGEDEMFVLGAVPLRFLSPSAFFRYLDTMMTSPPAKAP